MQIVGLKLIVILGMALTDGIFALEKVKYRKVAKWHSPSHGWLYSYSRRFWPIATQPKSGNSW